MSDAKQQHTHRQQLHSDIPNETTLLGAMPHIADLILSQFVAQHRLQLLEFLSLLRQLGFLFLVDLLLEEDHVTLDVLVPCFVFVTGFVRILDMRFHLVKLELLLANLIA